MFVTVPFVIGIALCLVQSRIAAGIATRQVQTVGTYTTCTPQNHNRCEYTFSVRGEIYYGEDSLPATQGNVIPSPGTTAQIFYDVASPSTNSLEDYAEKSRGCYGLIIFMSVAVFGIALTIFISKHNSTTRTNSVPPADHLSL